MRTFIRSLVAGLALSLLATCQSVYAGGIEHSESSLAPPATSNGNVHDLIKSPRPHVVLVLGGGGCKAVAEIGVLRSLEQHHVKIDGIVGSSMGSTIGALYCAGKTPDQIEQLFVGGEMPKAMSVHLVRRIALEPLTKLSYLFRTKPYPGISSGSSLEKLLQKELPSTFDQLKLPFAAVATNLTDGQSEVLCSGDLPKAVLASEAFPRLVRPVQIGDKVYADGGVRANLPARLAQKYMEADVVIAVSVDTAIKPINNKKLKNANNLIARITDIMVAALDSQQAKQSDVLVYPNVDDIPLLTKDTEMLKKGVDRGELAANKEMAHIQEAIGTTNRKYASANQLDKAE